MDRSIIRSVLAKVATMRVRDWVIVALLLLAAATSARAASGDFQTLVSGLGAQLELRRVEVPSAGSGYPVPAPGRSWHPILQAVAPWSERYAGVFLKSSSGRLSLLFETLVPQRATLVELRLSVRRLLESLGSAESLWDNATVWAAGTRPRVEQ